MTERYPRILNILQRLGLRLRSPFRLPVTVTFQKLKDDKRSLLSTIRVPRNAGLPSPLDFYFLGNYWLWSNSFFLVASRFSWDGLRPQPAFAETPALRKASGGGRRAGR